MAHDNASSQSLQQLVAQIDAKPSTLLLPEFQRDFVWELEQTYALFDSLIRDIFIGSIIFGIPSFELTLRQIDTRARKGKGSRAKIERLHYTEKQIKSASQIHGLKIILDGQQRTTSIYRALKGLDRVYVAARADLADLDVKDLDLEDVLHPEFGVQGEDRADCICVPIHYAFRYVVDAPFDDEVRDYFTTKTRYGRALAQAGDQAALVAAFKAFRQLLPRFKTLFEEPRLLAYYLLDMSLDKFTTFFERSNSKGISLNFTDILAAKLFGKFNLRQSFDDLAEAHPGIPIKRELLVRAVTVITGREIKIEKSHILRELRAEDFVAHWDSVTRLYVRSLNYLHEQRYMVSIRWLPSENLLVPLMMFFHALEQTGQVSLTHQQQSFLRWWYWASVFSERFSSASNEKIEIDCRVLQGVARGESVENGFYLRLRPLVNDAEQLLSYRSSSSVIYRGVLNLVHYAAHGLRDWTNDGPISTSTLGTPDLHDHHFFPQAFLRRSASRQDRPDEVDELRDSVVNRVLMPRDTNMRASDKPPHTYLRDLEKLNPNLRQSMESHLIPTSLLDIEEQSYQIYRTLWERAEQIVALIHRETLEAEQQLKAGAISERRTAIA